MWGDSRVESVDPGDWTVNIGAPSAIRVERVNPLGAPESRSVFLKLWVFFSFLNLYNFVNQCHHNKFNF